MNKIEVVLGIIILLLRAISILFIYTGVVPSSEYPGRYTFSGLAHRSSEALSLIAVVGFVAVGHGAYRRKFREACLDFIAPVFAWIATVWVAMDLYAAWAGFIKSFPTSVVLMCFSIVPTFVLGIALTFDGTIDRHEAQTHPTPKPKNLHLPDV